MIKNILSKSFIVNTSLGASFSSEPLRVSRASGFNIQLIFSGTPNGVFKLQASHDLTNTPSEVTNWDDIPDSEQVVIEAGSHTWIIDDRYKWIRVRFIRAMGDGLCNGNLFAVEER